mmetsp:Transcript_73365/g.231706  ORF Transcript_73365/g.231706 Transcript_73365/m.231706 type:complete len:215 (+) Transcript_73365:461-1105(+)
MLLLPVELILVTLGAPGLRLPLEVSLTVFGAIRAWENFALSLIVAPKAVRRYRVLMPYVGEVCKETVCLPPSQSCRSMCSAICPRSFSSSRVAAAMCVSRHMRFSPGKRQHATTFLESLRTSPIFTRKRLSAGSSVFDADGCKHRATTKALRTTSFAIKPMKDLPSANSVYRRSLTPWVKYGKKPFSSLRMAGAASRSRISGDKPDMSSATSSV